MFKDKRYLINAERHDMAECKKSVNLCKTLEQEYVVF